jgi:hypothetical protein
LVGSFARKQHHELNLDDYQTPSAQRSDVRLVWTFSPHIKEPVSASKHPRGSIAVFRGPSLDFHRTRATRSLSTGDWRTRSRMARKVGHGAMRLNEDSSIRSTSSWQPHTSAFETSNLPRHLTRSFFWHPRSEFCGFQEHADASTAFRCAPMSRGY